MLIGSSLGGIRRREGGAAKWPDRVARLVLLAPALDFGAICSGPATSDREWKRTGRSTSFTTATAA